MIEELDLTVEIEVTAVDSPEALSSVTVPSYGFVTVPSYGFADE